jgi:phosphoglycerate dehydrogenase-like enzyme
MIAWGKNKSESRVTAEFYNCAVEVMRGAEAIGEYVALPQQEAFDIEYWLLEEAKLKRMPPERELAGRVVVVVGAGSGIGRVAAARLASEGAHVACTDVSEAGRRRPRNRSSPSRAPASGSRAAASAVAGPRSPSAQI